MKKILITFAALVFLMACKKTIPHQVPEMLYTDLTGKEIKFNERLSLDLNKDGEMDLTFNTLFVGDPIAQQDKEKYNVYSRINSLLPVNANENVPILNKGDRIPIDNFGGYVWYEITWIELAQKVTGITGPPFWEGAWKNSSHQYLPVQVKVGRQRYNGWVELSFDTQAEKIILHKAAISVEAGKEVIAGA